MHYSSRRRTSRPPLEPIGCHLRVPQMNYTPPDTTFTVLLDRERGKYDMNYVIRINQRDRRSDVKVRQAVKATGNSSLSLP